MTITVTRKGDVWRASAIWCGYPLETHIPASTPWQAINILLNIYQQMLSTALKRLNRNKSAQRGLWEM